jgi:hypothetical protein
MTPKQLAEANRAAKNGNRVQRVKVLVEGAYVTWSEVSKRTGRNESQCRHRYAHLKRSGKWPVTWESLA